MENEKRKRVFFTGSKSLARPTDAVEGCGPSQELGGKNSVEGQFFLVRFTKPELQVALKL